MATQNSDPIFGDLPDDALSNIGLSPQAEKEYLDALRSPTPARQAEALGIDATTASNLDPDAINRIARSKSQNYEVQKTGNVITITGNETPAGGEKPYALNKDYLEAQVGKLENTPQALQARLAQETGATDEPAQRKAILGYADQLATAVKDHRLDVVRSIPEKWLVAAKLYDAAYHGTLGPSIPGMNDPNVAAMIKQQQPKTGPMESFALNMMFDSKNKILPDYTSVGDMQNLGLMPPTDMGGMGAPGAAIPGVSRGTDAAGNPSFSNAPNVGAPSTIPQAPPSSPQTPASMVGPQQPTSPSPSQQRVLQGQDPVTSYTPTIQGVHGPVQGAPIAGPPPQAAPAPMNEMQLRQLAARNAQGAPAPTTPAPSPNVQQRHLQFAQAYKAAHPTATGAEIRQAYYQQFGFGN